VEIDPNPFCERGRRFCSACKRRGQDAINISLIGGILETRLLGSTRAQTSSTQGDVKDFKKR
jgi:hypothetical protein